MSIELILTGTNHSSSVGMHNVGEKGQLQISPSKVCREKDYCIDFDGIDQSSIIAVTVNDAVLVRNSGHWESVEHQKAIFSDGFGYNRIYAELENGELLESDLIEIQSQFHDLNENIRQLTEYIYENDESEDFLFGGKKFSGQNIGLIDSPNKAFEIKLQLLSNILRRFEACLPFYQAGAKNIASTAERIDSFEKLQYVNSNTIQYIAQHPEQLVKVNGYGIGVGSSYYQPVKTLITNIEYSYDIYENRCVLGFLRVLSDELLKLNSELIEETNSSACSFSALGTKRTQRLLRELQRKCDGLYAIYKHAHIVSDYNLSSTPRPTAIFTEIPEYRILYICMKEWFEKGPLTMTGGEYLMPFMNISTLYEVYVLLRMRQYIISKGYSYKKQATDMLEYKMPWNNKYENSNCNNYFKFENINGDTVTLFYQPVVFSGLIDQSTQKSYIHTNSASKAELSGLFRNTSTSFKCAEGYIDCSVPTRKENCFYTPDYILTVQKGDSRTCIIADAKFKRLNNVVQHDIPALALKYLFSLSAYESNTSIAGLILFCGQEKQEEQEVDRAKSIYDMFPDNCHSMPWIETIRLTESYSSNSELDRIIGNYL